MQGLLFSPKMNLPRLISQSTKSIDNILLHMESIPFISRTEDIHFVIGHTQEKIYFGNLKNKKAYILRSNIKKKQFLE